MVKDAGPSPGPIGAILGDSRYNGHLFKT